MRVSIRESDMNNPCARYTMNELEIRVKTNFTYVINIMDIANDLNIDPNIITKFFGQSLNCISKLKNRELQLNGTYDKNGLLNELRLFIKLYITCHKCDLPELDYLAKKKRLISSCRSCGYKKECDSNDKIFKAIHSTKLQKPSKNKDLMSIKQNMDNNKWQLDTSDQAVKNRRDSIVSDTKFVDNLIQ